MVKTKHLIYTNNAKQKSFLTIETFKFLKIKKVSPTKYINKQLNLHKPYQT